MSGWDGKGSTRRWRALRLVILARDGWTCRLGLPGCTGRAEHVHHVLGKQFGDDPSQLRAACANCNRKIGDPLRRRRAGQPGRRRGKRAVAGRMPSGRSFQYGTPRRTVYNRW
jgi:hypothetical protein